MVANVVLGNSAAADTGKPAGKTAGGVFAALLPQHEADEQAASGKAAPGNKKGRPDAKQSELARQFAALNIPVFLPQVAREVVSTASTGDGSRAKSEPGEKAAGPGFSGKFSVVGHDLKPEPFSAIAADAKGADTLTVDSKLKSGGEVPVLDSQPSAANAAAKVNHPNLKPELFDRIASKQADAKAAEGKPVEMPEATTQKAPEQKISELNAAQSEVQNLVSAQSATRPATSKPVQAIASLASSAVKIAVKQVLPAQSKLAVASTTALPGARILADRQSPAAQAQTNHPGGATHEPQTKQEHNRKQTEAAATATQSGVDVQSRDQVNAVGRVVSSGLNAESSRLSAGTTVGDGPTPPVKSDLPVHETPVASSTPLSLHSARLLESLGQSELRVGMKMGDLGNVEIRTQLHHDQLRAEISVERGDLGRSLTAEMPAVQQKLREHDVQMAAIVVNHQAAAGSGSFERGSQQQQQMTTPMAHVFGIEAVPSSSSPEEVRVTDNGLDIRI